jgi:hypothetical protein
MEEGHDCNFRQHTEVTLSKAAQCHLIDIKNQSSFDKNSQREKCSRDSFCSDNSENCGETDGSRSPVTDDLSVCSAHGVSVSSKSEHETGELNFSAVIGKEVFDVLEHGGSVATLVDARIRGGFETGSFLVTNLSAVVSQFRQWRAELPMVHPFYAVKCNPDPSILRVLAHLGCSFDCATMGEIDLVLNGLGDKLR